MPPTKDPWEEIPSSSRSKYQKLIDAFIPMIRLKPFDLWVNLRAHHRIAYLKQPRRGKYVARVQLAVHYIWDAPTQKDLKSLRPHWTVQTVKRWHDRFMRHVDQWGPGDVELVRLILQRKPTKPDLNLIDPSEFVVSEIGYRTGAHVKGVLDQAWKGNWDKLGNIQVHYHLPDKKLEMINKRPVLTIDSYHHSFYKPGEVPTEAMKWKKTPMIASSYFPQKTWNSLKIAHKSRGAEDWELA
jgi:hypothetical protein